MLFSKSKIWIISFFFILLSFLLANCGGFRLQLSKVVYDGNGSNGGTVPIDSNSYKYGQEANVLANSGNLVKSGAAFNGWNENSLGTGNSYRPGDKITVKAKTVLYALWGSGTITTIAGTGVSGDLGDGGAATSAQLNRPFGMVVDSSGALIFADALNAKVRKIASGTISTIAGTGTATSTGDGGLATAATFVEPSGIALDSSRNIYIVDHSGHTIRKINFTTNTISTYAGTGVFGDTGDGGAATSAKLNRPIAIVIDSNNNLYLSDFANSKIRKVTSTGIISTYAGTTNAGFSGDNGTATNAQLKSPVGLVFDSAGNLYFADSGNNRIRKIAASGIITTIAGNGVAGYAGDGGPATQAKFTTPQGVFIDNFGNIIIADTGNNVVRKIESSSGIVRTIAGIGGTGGFSGDGGAATLAQLTSPRAITMDPLGRLYIADHGNFRIRRVTY